MKAVCADFDDSGVCADRVHDSTGAADPNEW